MWLTLALIASQADISLNLNHATLRDFAQLVSDVTRAEVRVVEAVAKRRVSVLCPTPVDAQGALDAFTLATAPAAGADAVMDGGRAPATELNMDLRKVSVEQMAKLVAEITGHNIVLSEKALGKRLASVQQNVSGKDVGVLFASKLREAHLRLVKRGAFYAVVD